MDPCLKCPHKTYWLLIGEGCTTGCATLDGWRSKQAKRSGNVESVTFVKSVDCRVCVLEIRDAPRSKREKTLQERRKTRKCQGCDRLKESKKNV